MNEKDIARINELAQKKKSTDLSEEEIIEQKKLRNQYLSEFRENMKNVLENTKIQEPDGSVHPLKKKDSH